MDDSIFLVFISALNRYFDTIQYHDDIYDHETRVATLRHIYAETAKYFDQPKQRAAIKAQPTRFKAIMRTSSQVVVYYWPKCSLDVMVAVSVYFVHIVLLDDSTNNPSPLMLTFGNDLIKSEPQKHPFWSLMNAHLSKFLSYYGGLCSLAILRSTFDYFQGSEYFPGFLRRLNGLGGIYGGSLFPRDDFDEDALFPQITTAIAELEIPIAFINDLMSFYKEYGNPRDEVNLVSNWCTTEGLSISEYFERLTNETYRGSKRHFCDKRFRFKESYERCGDNPEELKFRKYYEKAMAIRTIDFKEWTVWLPVNGAEKMAEMNGIPNEVTNGIHDGEAEGLKNGISHGLGNGELLNLYATPMVAK
ncbi:Trichodiene synthase [Fusarium falciforme]|uniref:Trichodiene synthase n=1 Tax=Fusarium falciforme TaxID=195108 RepID=UPI00230068D0|nr:Trichodiene synthase [Fusarium falciforme]WAO96891.1 Trichodiene synthase [Fusarium falciforme]